MTNKEVLITNMITNYGRTTYQVIKQSTTYEVRSWAYNTNKAKPIPNK